MKWKDKITAMGLFIMPIFLAFHLVSYLAEIIDDLSINGLTFYTLLTIFLLWKLYEIVNYSIDLFTGKESEGK